MSPSESSLKEHSPSVSESAIPQQASNATPVDLFPLPLSDFEFYMLTDDRPSHPMVFVMTALIRGVLSESDFRAAVLEVLNSHPLLKCRIQHVRGLGWCWVPLECEASADRYISWKIVEGGDAVTPDIRQLPIQDDAGILIEVFSNTESATVILHLHHCCTDGIGGLQLMGELFARYGRRTAAPEDRVPELQVYDSAKLRLREDYVASDGAAERQKKSLGRILGKVSRLMFRTPVVIEASTAMQPAKIETRKTNRELAIQSRVLPKSVYRSLRSIAAGSDVSINDLLLAEMILHIREWNHRAGKGLQRKWIRLAVPLSMRTSKHDGMPCANVVSYALVTRCEQDCMDETALLRSIHEQTNDVLFNREGIVCLKLFRFLRKIPGAMRAFLRSKSVFSTMVVANVGDIRKRAGGRFPLDRGRWIAGNVIVEQIHGVAPVRPNTRAAMSIGDYAGELSMSLRTDATVFSSDESQRFLDEFIARLTMKTHADESSVG